MKRCGLWAHGATLALGLVEGSWKGRSPRGAEDREGSRCPAGGGVMIVQVGTLSNSPEGAEEIFKGL